MLHLKLCSSLQLQALSRPHASPPTIVIEPVRPTARRRLRHLHNTPNTVFEGTSRRACVRCLRRETVCPGCPGCCATCRMSTACPRQTTRYMSPSLGGVNDPICIPASTRRVMQAYVTICDPGPLPVQPAARHLFAVRPVGDLERMTRNLSTTRRHTLPLGTVSRDASV